MPVVGFSAKPHLVVDFVFRIVAVEPHHFAVAFEGEHVGRDAIEKPAIMGNHHGAAGGVFQRFFKRALGFLPIAREVPGPLASGQRCAADEL